MLNLPVGLLMTGVGGTSIAQWLPGGTLFPNLEAALAYVGVNGARSILWCQGEQDTLLGTTEAVYQSDLSTIIVATRNYAQWDVPWMVSQTSYTLGQTSSAVIAAQQAVVNGIDILSGPYTDQYGSAYRYDNIHFNLTGQLAVGGDWACDILLESIYPIKWIDPQHGVYLKRNVSEFLTIQKSVNQSAANVGDILTYTILLTNNSGGPLSNLLLTDKPGFGATFLPGSLIIGGQSGALNPMTGVPLGSLEIGQTETVTFKTTITAIPFDGKISNHASATFSYSTCNPPAGTSLSNTVVTNVAVINVLTSVYSQQISDLIHSIALEEAAIAGIANAEGAKIQKMLALRATPNELLCVNKSVLGMLEALGTLESVLKQKLGTVDCQIVPTCMG